MWHPWHKWTKWSGPEQMTITNWVGHQYEQQAQERSCTRCGIVQRRVVGLS